MTKTKQLAADLEDQLQASGAWLASLARKAEQTAQGLFQGDLEQSATLYQEVLDSLGAFLGLIDRTHDYAGRWRPILEHYRFSLTEQMSQLDQFRRANDLEELAEALQFELVPFFESWDGLWKAMLKNSCFSECSSTAGARSRPPPARQRAKKFKDDGDLSGCR